jgi:TolA-binding protein
MTTYPTNNAGLNGDSLTGFASGKGGSREELLGLLNDPFALDALEGLEFAEVSESELTQMDAQLQQLARSGKTSGDGGAIAGVFVAVAFLTTLMVQGLVSTPKINPEIQAQSPVTSQQPAIDTAGLSAAMSITLTEKQDTNSIMEELALATNLPKPGQSAIPVLSSIEKSNITQELIALDPSLLIEADKLPVKPLDVRTGNLIRGTSISTRYAAGYLIADLSDIYHNKLKVRNRNVPTGTQVYDADKKDNPNPIEGPYYFIAYSDYMNAALQRFEDKKYAGCLKDLAHLLSIYPSDINALFYSGLCRYNLGMYPEALSHFGAVRIHPASIFREEGTWYYALTLLALDRKPEAKDLLQEIARNGGFYRDQARKQLRSLH